ncbi:hypothetical protein VTO42DRAFT_5388 [Malbranchea cinnamomea]
MSAVIDLGEITHASGERELFESLDKSYKGRLGTASKATVIEGIGTLRIDLLNKGTLVRLRVVKYVPGLKGTLLSTQVLHVNRILNEHGPKGYTFFQLKEDGIRKVVVRGKDHGVSD